MKVVPGKHYLAFVLDEACKKMILGLYPANHPVVKCDHVTISYPVMEEDVNELQAVVDSNPVFKLNGFIEADGIDVFRVAVNNYCLRPDGKHYHLTYSRLESRASSDSNKVFDGEIIARSYSTAEEVLTGEFKLVPFGQ